MFRLSILKLLYIVEFHFEIAQDEARQGKIDSGEQERERIFQHKVSYATLQLILLQVTNYCILISMLPEERGMRRGGKEEGNRRPTRSTAKKQH